jgi:hypothetical protein
MGAGLTALVAGLWGGLLRLGWTGAEASLAAIHGPLMVCGFLGTVVGLERAVALRQSWALGVPILAGGGGILMAVDVAEGLGPVLITLASVGLIGIFTVVLSRQVVPFLVVMAGGACAWAVGNVLWVWGWTVSRLVPWWMGFLVLTIAGERLELSRMQRYPPWVRRLFLGALGATGVGLTGTLGGTGAGFRVFGGGLLATAVWLCCFDVARHTVREDTLPRYTAVCLLLGYGWLIVGGALGGLYGNPGGGLVYDAILHAVFVGFVFSMIFGHAPVIFPSVLGVPVPYHPVLYGPLAVLHTSLLFRVVGDLAAVGPLRRWGGVANAGAIGLFLVVLVSRMLGARPADGPTNSAVRPTQSSDDEPASASNEEALSDLSIDTE